MVLFSCCGTQCSGSSGIRQFRPLQNATALRTGVTCGPGSARENCTPTSRHVPVYASSQSSLSSRLSVAFATRAILPKLLDIADSEQEEGSDPPERPSQARSHPKSGNDPVALLTKMRSLSVHEPSFVRSASSSSPTSRNGIFSNPRTLVAGRLLVFFNTSALTVPQLLAPLSTLTPLPQFLIQKCVLWKQEQRANPRLRFPWSAWAPHTRFPHGGGIRRDHQQPSSTTIFTSRRASPFRTTAAGLIFRLALTPG